MIKTLLLGIFVFITAFLVFYFLSFFVFPNFFGGFSYGSNWHASAYQSLEKKIWDKMERKHQLQMSSFGGRFSEEIGPVSFGFRVSKEYNKDEARVLMVEVMEDIKKEINRARELRPYLIHFPMNENEISISISFYDPKTNVSSNSPFVTGVSSISGGVNYSEEGKNSFEDIIAIHESYAEAKLKAEAYLAEKKKERR